MGRLTLILGGARSGKSTYAERLAMQHSQRVAYIATAQALDLEMEARIAMHQQKRPSNWQTLEIPSGIGLAIKSNPPEVDTIILDCITLLVSNLVLEASTNLDEPEEERATALIDNELTQLQEAIQTSQAEWIVVSNEVGMGLVPPYPLGRIYRDLLGMANQSLASIADQVYFMIAGIPMRLTPEK